MAEIAQPTVKSLTRPYRDFVIKADPDFEKDKRNEPEYEFTNKTFRANRATRSAYSSAPSDAPPTDVISNIPIDL